MTSDSTLFAIADTLNMPLHPVGEGYRSVKSVKLPFGPWQLEIDITAKSDVLEKDKAAFFAHLHDDLWAYIISRKGGDIAHLIVFSGSAAKVDKGTLITPFVQGDLKATIKRLLDAGGVAFTHTKGKWALDPSVAKL
jgi:hypothetical protein